MYLLNYLLNLPPLTLCFINVFILAKLSMFFYSGGHFYNRRAKWYAFHLNIFSDLGRLHSLSGYSNILSATCFIGALIHLGTVFINFFSPLVSVSFPPDIGAFFGVITGICAIG